MATRARALLAPTAAPRFMTVALVALFALFALASAWFILRGKGFDAIAGLVLFAFYLTILVRWRRGFYGLLAYLPFAGVATLLLYPWEGLPWLNPVLYKDWLFVLPTYLGFFGAAVLGRERLMSLPRLPAILLTVFSSVVIAQMANPGVPNMLTGLIGAKVWLFYLPLYALAFELICSRMDLTFLLRFFVVLATVPCTVGVAEYILVRVYGYETVMSSIYGTAAFAVTQEYAQFEVAGGLIARIPSTFTFVTQFFGFMLSVLVPTYIVYRTDPSQRWRKFARWTLALITVASFLSGARVAFVFVPLLLGLIYGLDRGFRGFLRGGAYLAGLFLAALAIAHISALELIQYIFDLFGNYAADTAYAGLAQAVTTSILGSGTGTNTGPARYAFEKPDLFTAIQNYYAKAVFELGIVGLLLLLGLFITFIRQGFRLRRKLHSPELRVCAVGFLAFVIAMSLNCFKGWLIDLDPINVYFWVFMGLLAKLPLLDPPEAATGRAP